MYKGDVVLCGANAYKKAYYLNKDFEGLPESVKDELKVMCVLFTEDVGGIFYIAFDEEGNLELRVTCDEGDLLYDDVGCGLKIRELQRTREDLLRSLELYYKVVYM